MISRSYSEGGSIEGCTKKDAEFGNGRDPDRDADPDDFGDRFPIDRRLRLYRAGATAKLLVARLHPAGTERVVSGLPPFTIVIGNAEHVKLTYNDRPVDLKPYIKVEVARFSLE